MNAFFREVKFQITHFPKTISNHFYSFFPFFALDRRTKNFMKKNMDKKNHNGKVFRQDVEDNLKAFLPPEELNNTERINKLTFDIVKSYVLNGITPDEYFLHSFPKKDLAYRYSILSRRKKDSLCCKYLGQDTQKYLMQLKDKWQFYNLAKPYFKRDVCRVENDSDLISIEEFCAKHSRFIAKPRLASSGIGVHVVDLQKEPMTAKSLLEHYQKLEDGKWMFEEFIEQAPEMAAWHPSSVNTIRIPSIRTKKGCTVILPLFRTGKNGNLVDNCHNDGGLMAVPDAKTGVLLTDGYDVFTNVVETHPNSGMRFKGWQVPRWDELIATASELHQSLPIKHKYVGFDFALTPKGWAVVEGNWGNFPHQVCVGYGIRDEFERLMKS